MGTHLLIKNTSGDNNYNNNNNNKNNNDKNNTNPKLLIYILYSVNK
jgi:hypothetical protein